MRNHEEINVLKETRKNASMAVNAIDALMGKIYNQEFAYELTAERERFRDFERRAEAGLWEHGLVSRDSGVQKAMLWGSIQANTLMNISTNHMADMVIQGNAKGIAELRKTKHNNTASGSFANELAEELMDFEEENSERLKRFL